MQIFLSNFKWWPVRDSNPCMHAWKACVLNRFTNGPFIFRFATSLFYHLDLFSSRDFFKFFKRNYSIILSTNISFVKYFLKFFVSSFYLPETNFYIIPSLSFLVKPFLKKVFQFIPFSWRELLYNTKSVGCCQTFLIYFFKNIKVL